MLSFFFSLVHFFKQSIKDGLVDRAFGKWLSGNITNNYFDFFGQIIFINTIDTGVWNLGLALLLNWRNQGTLKKGTILKVLLRRLGEQYFRKNCVNDDCKNRWTSKSDDEKAVRGNCVDILIFDVAVIGLDKVYDYYKEIGDDVPTQYSLVEKDILLASLHDVDQFFESPD